MRRHKYDVVVVGAGITGIAAAYALSRAGQRVAIVEEGPPLGLTSDKSTECYRNFWPGPDDAMLALMRDSITRLSEHSARSGDRFQMRQRGYLFATAREEEIEALLAQAEEVERYGGGPVRQHDNVSGEQHYMSSPVAGFDQRLDGADLITSRHIIRRHFPYLADDTKAVMHVRQCGALSAQQLGMYLLEEARGTGAELIVGQFTGIETVGGRFSSAMCRTADGDQHIDADALVIATGPHLKATAALAGSELPVKVERHIKISISDRAGVIPRDAPLIIWNDPIKLAWTADEREMLALSPETERLLQSFPAGVHGRPVGAGDQVLMYWTYDCELADEPVFPLEWDPYLPEITLRGMARMVPGLEAYFDPMPKPFIDGGYYTKTADNRPLIGPLTTPGTFVCSAFSGYGIMASCAGGELMAAHVLGRALPAYAKAFEVGRFDDAAYLQRIEGLAGAAQL